MNIGFIGFGNMAKAIYQGIAESDLAPEVCVMASAASPETRAKIREMTGTEAGDNAAAAAFADVLFLAVKPFVLPFVLPQIKGSLRKDALVISMAAGRTIADLESALGEGTKIVRIMPNTPAKIGLGMTGMCAGASVTEAQKQTAERLCGTFGKTEWVSERLMDVVTAVSGSSPAFVYMMIEAMADGAVAEGMPRAQAYRMAAAAVAGAAGMVLDTGLHPGELKDQVCSPAGTTIEAVRVLEEKGFRSALMEAEIACVRKARSL